MNNSQKVIRHLERRIKWWNLFDTSSRASHWALHSMLDFMLALGEQKTSTRERQEQIFFTANVRNGS